ncbi:MAG: alpha/beta hydrolase [Pseudomonadota bacterium]
MNAMIKMAVGIAVAALTAACDRTTTASDSPAHNASKAGGAYVETALGRLFVKTTGTGDATLVLWPSIFTDHRIYDRVTAELSDKFRFLLIDGPGHGGSEGPTEEFSIAQSADAMAAVLDHYQIQSAVIGGTSWGGMTAAELALSRPERVRGLILMNTPMEIDGDDVDFSSRLISFGARYGLGFRFFRDGVAESFFSPEVLENDPDFAATFHEMLKTANARELSASVRSVLLRGSPLMDRMAELNAPTLVIAGREDEMYPVHVQRAAASMAPQGEFALVAGKHISVVERPLDVARIIEDFVARTAERR